MNFWSESRNQRLFTVSSIALPSVPLNIAEGTGKFTPPDRCRYYDTARGSVECAACLDVLVAKKIAAQDEIAAGKELLRPMVSMLVGLIKSAAPGRIYEEPDGFGEKSVGES
ncbi:MAG: four helix bundle protein [Chthoniobacterales bacterium]